MSGYPWSVLDLEHDAGMQDIRKAYARKLKTVRPDEDPTGFQALVEARDLALRIVERQVAVGAGSDHAVTLDFSRPTDGLTVEAEATPPPPTSILPGTPDADISEQQHVERSGDAEANRPVGSPDRSVLSHQSMVEDADTPPPQIIIAHRAPDEDRSDEQHAGPFNDPEFLLVQGELVKLAISSQSYFDIDRWAALLPKLGHLSIEQRERLEPSVIGSFWNILRVVQGRPSLPEVSADPKDRQLITLYDEEFGWSLSDLKVYEIIGKHAGDDFKWRLSQTWGAQRPDHEFGRRALAMRAEREAAARRQAKRDPSRLLVWFLVCAAFLVMRYLYGF